MALVMDVPWAGLVPRRLLGKQKHQSVGRARREPGPGGSGEGRARVAHVPGRGQRDPEGRGMYPIWK